MSSRTIDWGLTPRLTAKDLWRLSQKAQMSGLESLQFVERLQTSVKSLHRKNNLARFKAAHESLTDDVFNEMLMASGDGDAVSSNTLLQQIDEADKRFTQHFNDMVTLTSSWGEELKHHRLNPSSAFDTAPLINGDVGAELLSIFAISGVIPTTLRDIIANLTLFRAQLRRHLEVYLPKVLGVVSQYTPITAGLSASTSDDMGIIRALNTAYADICQIDDVLPTSDRQSPNAFHTLDNKIISLTYPRSIPSHPMGHADAILQRAYHITPIGDPVSGSVEFNSGGLAEWNAFLDTCLEIINDLSATYHSDTFREFMAVRSAISEQLKRLLLIKEQCAESQRPLIADAIMGVVVSYGVYSIERLIDPFIFMGDIVIRVAQTVDRIYT